MLVEPSPTPLAASLREGPGANPLPELDALLASAAVEPRGYQRRIVSSALQMFAGTWRGPTGEIGRPATSVLIESPTGSGKTVMGLATAALVQRATGCRVGWVAMRRNLLHQAEAENARAGFGVDLQPISMFDKDPPPCDLLVDEAQHDAATSMANLHCKIRPQLTLGLSATPTAPTASSCASSGCSATRASRGSSRTASCRRTTTTRSRGTRPRPWRRS
ncbi:MAG: DEAD/DEAH box helicase family protein [Myxococcota bacterium]